MPAPARSRLQRAAGPGRNRAPRSPMPAAGPPGRPPRWHRWWHRFLLPGWLQSWCSSWERLPVRLLALAEGLERLAGRVLRRGGVVGHELHLQAGRGELHHVGRLVAAAADRRGHLGDLGRLPVQGRTPGARHGLVPAGARRRGDAAAAGARAVGEGGVADELVECGTVDGHVDAPVLEGYCVMRPVRGPDGWFVTGDGARRGPARWPRPATWSGSDRPVRAPPRCRARPFPLPGWDALPGA